MRRKKSRDIQLSKVLNEVIVGGVITNKSKLITYFDFKFIKLVIDESIYCIAQKKLAEELSTIPIGTTIIIVGKIELFNFRKKGSKEIESTMNIVKILDFEVYSTLNNKAK